MIRHVLLLLICMGGLVAAEVVPVQLTHNGWTVSLDDRRVAIERGGQTLGTAWLFDCSLGVWRKSNGSWTTTAASAGKDVAVVAVALDHAGRLRLTCTSPAGSGPTLLIGLPTSLKESGLTLDGAPFSIPGSVDDALRVWGIRKEAVLFTKQADHRLGLAVLSAKDASVRDLRGGREGLDKGSFDFAFYLHPAADGRSMIDLDLTQAGAKP